MNRVQEVKFDVAVTVSAKTQGEVAAAHNLGAVLVDDD
jgi:hypothetical protein